MDYIHIMTFRRNIHTNMAASNKGWIMKRSRRSRSFFKLGHALNAERPNFFNKALLLAHILIVILIETLPFSSGSFIQRWP